MKKIIIIFVLIKFDLVMIDLLILKIKMMIFF